MTKTEAEKRVVALEAQPCKRPVQAAKTFERIEHGVRVLTFDIVGCGDCLPCLARKTAAEQPESGWVVLPREWTQEMRDVWFYGAGWKGGWESLIAKFERKLAVNDALKEVYDAGFRCGAEFISKHNQPVAIRALKSKTPAPQTEDVSPRTAESDDGLAPAKWPRPTPRPTGTQAEMLELVERIWTAAKDTRWAILRAMTHDPEKNLLQARDAIQEVIYSDAFERVQAYLETTQDGGKR